MNKFQALDNRSIISISGKNKFTFLQGLVTNDIRDIESEKLDILYTLMLTPQGRFMYDFFIFCDGDRILIDHESQFTSEIISKLSLYKLRSDVVINGSKDQYKIIFIDQKCDSIESGEYCFPDPRDSRLSFRAYIPNDRLESFLQRNKLLEENSMYDSRLYELCIPDPHKDMIQTRSFPLEYGMENFHAISFDKGCYMGQENTARTKYRGTVRKKLFKFITDSTIKNIDIGTEIYHGDSKIGMFCSSHGSIGKALLRIEELESAGTKEFMLGEYRIKIS